jgi:hypothetical protein
VRQRLVIGPQHRSQPEKFVLTTEGIVDKANTQPSSKRSFRVTLEWLGALLLFSLAVLIQDIVAQDLAGPTEADFVGADSASRLETVTHDIQSEAGAAERHR